MSNKDWMYSNSIAVSIYEDAAEASAAGYDYKDRPIMPVVIKEAIVVNKGTVQGNPTIDFLMQDELGNKYVALVSGRLLKTLLRGVIQ